MVDPSKAADSAIGTLSIVQERDSKGYKAWFAHFPVPVQTAPIEFLPNATIGFHEYKAQYYYAVVDFNGVTLDLGEITLPLHLTTGEGAQSDNYVFGLAKAMINVSTSEKYAALIGIEDTLWKTSTPKLDAAENRVVFSHPRQRIFEVVSYKAAINGLLQPISVKHIAPSRDCGQCGQRTDNSSIQMFPTTRCFICSALRQKHTLQRIEQGTTLGWKCSDCNRHWQQKEPQFKCSACGYRQHARYNTAVVVAHALRHQMIDSNDRNKDEMEV